MFAVGTDVEIEVAFHKFVAMVLAESPHDFVEDFSCLWDSIHTLDNLSDHVRFS